MSRSSKACVAETRRKVLSFVAECGGRNGYVVVPLKRIASALGISTERVRGAVRWLHCNGCLEVEQLFAHDGGQRPNAYLITDKGAGALVGDERVLW